MEIKIIETPNGMDKLCLVLPIEVDYGSHTEAITFYADVPKGKAEEVLASVSEYIKTRN